MTRSPVNDAVPHCCVNANITLFFLLFAVPYNGHLGAEIYAVIIRT